MSIIKSVVLFKCCNWMYMYGRGQPDWLTRVCAWKKDRRRTSRKGTARTPRSEPIHRNRHFIKMFWHQHLFETSADVSWSPAAVVSLAPPSPQSFTASETVRLRWNHTIQTPRPWNCVQVLSRSLQSLTVLHYVVCAWTEYTLSATKRQITQFTYLYDPRKTLSETLCMKRCILSVVNGIFSRSNLIRLNVLSMKYMPKWWTHTTVQKGAHHSRTNKGHRNYRDLTKHEFRLLMSA